MTTRLLRIAAVLAMAAPLACASDSIAWDDPTPLPPAVAAEARLAFDGGALAGQSASAVVPARVAGQCVGSVRVAGDSVTGWYAVWWEAQPDSTAHVMVARSRDGLRWDPAIRVDTMDAGRVGCRRPPPSIAADGQNVHVAYGMAAREGPGIFASHSMDEGVMFHSPVAVVYGERIGHTAIAARGDLVAVVYEDPNAAQPRVGLAFSHTMAHLFQVRQVVSPPTGPARAPDVAIGDGKLAVAWSRGAATDTTPRFVRIGVLP
ncbi:MAG: hypothetical protein WD801_09215 [Gemmatimonadaceae bacterium]